VSIVKQIDIAAVRLKDIFSGIRALDAKPSTAPDMVTIQELTEFGDEAVQLLQDTITRIKGE
jgi:hypothetical protein